jgi:outer membrane protein assembly factor BamA
LYCKTDEFIKLRKKLLSYSFTKNTICLILILSSPDILVNGQESAVNDSVRIGMINIEGNRITKSRIVFRELAFRVNQYVKWDELDYLKEISINNLTKTSLFNFIEIFIDDKQPGIVIITVKLTERWYIWPTLYLNHTDLNFAEWWRTKDLNKLEYGFGAKVNNFRGMKETLLLNIRVGNFTKYELEYKGIHLDPTGRHLLSLKTAFSEQSYLPWGIESNKLMNLKSNRTLLTSTDFALKYVYRKAFFNSHSATFGYTDDRIADTVVNLNNFFFGLDSTRQKYLSLEYEFTRDTRDSRAYPKTGYFLLASIRKTGLGLLREEFNGADFRFQYSDYRKISRRFYTAAGVYFASNANNYKDFFSQTGLGYLNFVRGYEYYAVNGDEAILLKSLLKYELLPKKVVNLNFWPIRKAYQINKIPLEIYANVYFDAGYVNDRQGLYKINNNTLVNELMYSAGVGIDFVTYYDKVLRFDYSINAMGDYGLYIHWKAPIR